MVHQEAKPLRLEKPDGHLALKTTEKESPISSDPAIGRMAVLAGAEEILAVLRTVVLLARNFQGTLRLLIPENETVVIHFGKAPCPNLLLGLMDAVRRQLDELSALSGGTFIVELDILSTRCTVSMQVSGAGALPWTAMRHPEWV